MKKKGFSFLVCVIALTIAFSIFLVGCDDPLINKAIVSIDKNDFFYNVDVKYDKVLAYVAKTVKDTRKFSTIVDIGDYKDVWIDINGHTMQIVSTRDGVTKKYIFDITEKGDVIGYISQNGVNYTTKIINYSDDLLRLYRDVTKRASEIDMVPDVSHVEYDYDSRTYSGNFRAKLLKKGISYTLQSIDMSNYIDNIGDVRFEIPEQTNSIDERDFWNYYVIEMNANLKPDLRSPRAENWEKMSPRGVLGDITSLNTQMSSREMLSTAIDNMDKVGKFATFDDGKSISHMSDGKVNIQRHESFRLKSGDERFIYNCSFSNTKDAGYGVMLFENIYKNKDNLVSYLASCADNENNIVGSTYKPSKWDVYFVDVPLVDFEKMMPTDINSVLLYALNDIDIIGATKPTLINDQYYQFSIKIDADNALLSYIKMFDRTIANAESVKSNDDYIVVDVSIWTNGLLRMIETNTKVAVTGVVNADVRSDVRVKFGYGSDLYIGNYYKNGEFKMVGNATLPEPITPTVPDAEPGENVPGDNVEENGNTEEGGTPSEPNTSK